MISKWWAICSTALHSDHMAEHKVPQNVETEDKLLGPFSFRQFIYLMVALAGGALAFFLGRVNIVLAIIPSPVFVVFLVLALPLKKDQPMETYVAALIQFYFNPSRRIWDPDGLENTVQITNPPIDTTPLTKDFGAAEAAQRLSFLAEVSDTRGWSTRGMLMNNTNQTNLIDDFAADAYNTQDVYDADSYMNQRLNDQLIDTEERHRQDVMQRIQAAPTTQTPTYYPQQYIQPAPQPQISPAEEASISAALKQSSVQPVTHYKQTVIQPVSVQAPVAPAIAQAPVTTPVISPVQPQQTPVQAPTPQTPTQATTITDSPTAYQHATINDISNIHVPDRNLNVVDRQPAQERQVDFGGTNEISLRNDNQRTID